MLSWLKLCVFKSFLVATFPENRPNGSVVYLAQAEGLGIKVNNHPAGPKARQFTV